MTRLRIFKAREEATEQSKPVIPDAERPPRIRRRSTRSENIEPSENTNPLLPVEDGVKSKLTCDSPTSKEQFTIENAFKKDIKPMTESLKSRAAIFEQNAQKVAPAAPLISNKTRTFRDQTKQTDLFAKNLQDTRDKIYGKTDAQQNLDEFKDLDFIRNKRTENLLLKEERRRHTYDTREREPETERLRRISLESRSPK